MSAVNTPRPPVGTLGTWLAGMLRSRGWTQTYLAEQMGIDPSMVSKWVRGAKSPSAPYCESIARTLGVPPAEVLALAGLITTPRAAEYGPDPTRARAHALIDALDPRIVASILPLLTVLHRLATGDSG